MTIYELWVRYNLTIWRLKHFMHEACDWLSFSIWEWDKACSYKAIWVYEKPLTRRGYMELVHKMEIESSTM